MNTTMPIGDSRPTPSRTTWTTPLLGAIAVAAIAWGAGRVSAHDAEDPSADGADGALETERLPEFVPPARSGLHTRAPAQNPPLPPELDHPMRLTAIVETRDPRGHVLQKKTVTRTANRVHVRVGAQGPEWLFVRNPVDGRRVTAVLIEHRRRTLVDYDESELAMTGLARGWADVASLGVEPEALFGSKSTGKASSLGGYSFKQLQPGPDQASSVRELWWSHELAVARRIVLQDQLGERVVEVVGLSNDVDEGILDEPSKRFPRYQQLDVADFREKHHEHGAASRAADKGHTHDASHEGDPHHAAHPPAE